jgi:DNA-binding Lrp family transcriptional regulator
MTGTESAKDAKIEAPYRILMSLYKDSRVTVKRLSEELELPRHRIAKILGDLERTRKIAYTLQIDESKLGFSEGRIVTIKFGAAPDMEMIRKRLEKDIAVQDAYLAIGDFDLLIYAVGMSHKDYLNWQWHMRVDFGEYKPVLKSASADSYHVGFFPLRTRLIEKSSVLSDLERRILVNLNKNSRIRMKDLIRRCRSTQMRVIYALKKLEEREIIRRFSGLVQETDKRIILAYTESVIPIKDRAHIQLAFYDAVSNENYNEASNDYCVFADTSGAYDGLFLCTFENSDALYKKGPASNERIFAEESPKIEKAALTDVIVGKWPFHLENYSEWNGRFRKLSGTEYD